MKKVKLISLMLAIMLVLSTFFACDGCSCGKNNKKNSSSNPQRPASANEQEIRDQMEAEEVLRRQTFTFTPGQAIANSVGVDEVYEYGFDISATYQKGDHFIPNIVDIRAEITTPSGTTNAMCFYKQNEGETDLNRWAFRYAPTEEGNYSFRIYDYLNPSATPITGNFTATARPAASSGRLSVVGDRIVNAKGEQFVTIGTNVLDIPLTRTDLDMNTNGKYSFEGFIDEYADTGANIIRTWGEYNSGIFTLELAPTTVTESGVQITYEGLGRYQLENAARMDSLLEYAESKDFYINVALFNQWSFGDNFKKNAYALMNDVVDEVTGQVIEDNSARRAEFPYARVVAQSGTTNFWNNEPALKYQEQLVRYYAARYSAYRSLGLFEWWNEVDSHASAYSDMYTVKWVYRMEEIWDACCSNQVYTANSFAWKDHDANGNPWVYYEGKTDVAQPHFYIGEYDDPVNMWNEVISNIKAVYTGPIFYGEFGEDNCENWSSAKYEGGQDPSNPGVTYESVKEFSNYYFMEGFWSPFFLGGASGGNLFWKINQNWNPNQDCRNYMSYFANTIDKVDDLLPTMTHFGGETVSEMQFGGYKSATAVAAYVRDTNAANGATYDTGKKDAENNPVMKALPSYKAPTPRTNSSYTQVIEGMTNGNYSVTYVNILTGAETTSQQSVSNGTLTLSFPSFTRGMAVVVRPV